MEIRPRRFVGTSGAIVATWAVFACELALPIHEGAGAASSTDASVDGDASLATDGAGGAATDLIDDMENQTGRILVKEGRDGAWFTFDDGTRAGVIVPADAFGPSQIVPPRGSSSWAARFQAHGFGEWGAAMGFDLNQPVGAVAARVYDASKYTGFEFWARVGPGSTTSIVMEVPDGNTAPQADCGSSCGAHHATTLRLTTAWEKITVAFADLAVAGEAPGGLDRSRLYGINFVAAKNTTADVWIDDLAFLEP
jgi:hypothetical protein